MKTTEQNNIQQQIVELVQQLLRDSGVEYTRRITPDSSLQRHLGLDSLGRAELFQRLEKQFQIQLPDRIIAEADTINDLANAVAEAKPAKKLNFQNIIQSNFEKTHIDPAQAKTLVDVLVLYAKGDPNRPHIFMQDEEGREEIITYGMLLENSLRMAQAFLKRGLTPGSTIAIMQPTNPGFFYTFFGALLANCIPVPIYPPFRPRQIEAYAKQEAKILKNAEVRLLVTFHEAEKLSKLLRAFVPSLKEVTTVNALFKNEEKAPIFGAKESDFAMIQYTSGSTSAPKGVLLSHFNMLSNIRAYGQATQIVPTDVTVSWAPLYHDLGLIGMWLGSLYHGVPLVLMSPLTFLNRPERWLWAIHNHRGTISGGPNFAYELCVRKIDPAKLEGLDLSSWRVAANAAEAIQPKTLERFTEKFAPFGFKPEAFVPAYGLAESTVGVAVSPLNRKPRIDKIERQAFEEKSQAIPTTDENSLEFVACGIPIPNHFVRIVDEQNQELPERHIGMLQFSGPSSMQGYYGNPDATLAIYHDGWWDSGDLAYIVDGEIFITGRKKDVIIKAGRNLYPSEVEELTAQVPEIRKGCVIAFGTIDPKLGTEKLIVVAETRDKKPADRQKLIEDVATTIAGALDIAPDHVVLVPPHTIPKTSSGKLQRGACKAAYLSGKLTSHRTPMWLQITKIGASSIGATLRRYLANTGKLLYTIYLYLLFGLFLLPIYLSMWILPQRTFAKLCHYSAHLLSFLAFCPLRVYDKKNLYAQKPLIFAANHTSYIDAVLLLAIAPVGTKIVGKQELIKKPIVGRFMRKLGFLFVDRTDLPKGLEDTKLMEDILRDKTSIAIFPEGTFGYATGLRPFKSGAFKIAAETGTAICPIAINGARHILRGEQRLFAPGIIRVTIGEPIAPEGNDWQDITNLKNKVRAQIAKNCGEPTLDIIPTGIPD
ncbi:MAG: AMP-binding protein [Gammaproteobacteria bacterium]